MPADLYEQAAGGQILIVEPVAEQDRAGDTIRAFNDRGYVVLKAEIDAGLRPGVTVYPKGWQASQFIDGHVSNLTSSYTIPSMYNNYYFDTLCQVEKCEED